MKGHEKKHYYSFSFIENNAGEIKYASIYIGYPEKFVSIPQIADAKKSAKVTQDTVMVSCCYLGHMTNKEVGYAQSEEK